MESGGVTGPLGYGLDCEDLRRGDVTGVMSLPTVTASSVRRE